tara:strand:- start:103 stop:462 length:360 start_codon:yes stop_codon:yes gene_type:complete
MANPNVVSVAQIFGTTVTKGLPASLAAVVSAVPTGDVYKVNSILCCNIHTAAVTVDVKIIRDSGSSDDDTFIVKGLSIPVGATLDVLNKPIYLMEGDELHANSTATSYVDMTVSYEDIS